VASWDAAEDWADIFGLEGAAYIGGSTAMERAREIVDRWLQSFPCFRLFWNGAGELEIAIFDPTVWQGYPSGSDRRISTEQLSKGSYVVGMNTDKITKRISSSFCYSAADGQAYGLVDVEDMIQPELVTLSQRIDWSIARAS
jgi:hypothetical protein